MHLFRKDFSRFHSNARHYKKEFECSFHSLKNWSRMTYRLTVTGVRDFHVITFTGSDKMLHNSKISH